MYALTIVMLFSNVTLVSTYATQDACEDAARVVRQQVEGPQAVSSAICAYVKGESSNVGALVPLSRWQRVNANGLIQET